MKTVLIKRTDFNGHSDEHGKEYFDYILDELDIPVEQWDKIS